MDLRLLCRVVTLPENALAFTNHVYANPRDWARWGSPTCIEIQSFRFHVATNAIIQPDTLGLSKLQRDLVTCKVDDTVDISLHPAPVRRLLSCHLITKTLCSHLFEIPESQLLSLLTQAWKGHVLYAGQDLVLDTVVEGSSHTIMIHVSRLTTDEVKTPTEIYASGEWNTNVQVKLDAEGVLKIVREKSETEESKQSVSDGKM